MKQLSSGVRISGSAQLVVNVKDKYREPKRRETERDVAIVMVTVDLWCYTHCYSPRVEVIDMMRT